jgi:anti-sigma-K factor RskA
MRYTNATLRDMLASEYALGTLRGAARRRFEQVLAGDRELRQLVEQWEGKLNVLAQALPGVQPPAGVWRNIERRLWPGAPSLWSSLAFWRALALASSALVLVLAIYVGVRPVPEAATDVVAVLASQNQEPGWVVTFSRADPRRLQARALTGVPPRPEGAYELWVIPQGAKVPLAVGLLPAAGNASISLPEPVRDLVVRPGVLAVSLEPEGGSRTGLPTGPVVYQGRLLAL